MAKIQNADRLRRKLKTLTPDLVKSLKPGMEQGAEQITALMRHLVPVLKKSTKYRTAGALRDSIGWRTKETPGKDLEVMIFAGSRERGGAYYSRFVEFGVHEQTKGERILQISRTKGKLRSRKSRRTVGFIPAQPFFFPAFRAYKRSVGAKMTKAAKASLKKTAST